MSPPRQPKWECTPSSSSASGNVITTTVPCCSSSSSDEAELVDTDTRGWPSVASVLETPDRRRARKTLRMVALRRDLNSEQPPPLMGTPRGATAIIALGAAKSLPPRCPPIGGRCLLLPTNPNSNGLKRSAPSASGNGIGPEGTTPHLLFNSPPPTSRMRRQSPTLCTPKSSSICRRADNIHLSVSPMSAFFVRQRLPPGHGAAGHCSPGASSSSPSSCSSSSASAVPVLRPLNTQHNKYIGIRFSGEQPEEVTRTHQLLNPALMLHNAAVGNEENSFVPEVKKLTKEAAANSSSRRSSAASGNDSGFFDSSSSVVDASGHQQRAQDDGNNNGTTTTLIETPSKGLLIVEADQSRCIASSSVADDAPSTSSPGRQCLRYPSNFLDFGHALQQQAHLHSNFIQTSNSSSLCCLDSSPNSSTIPEQSYGPLEASVMDGILNDLSMWPESNKSPAGRKPTTTSSNSSPLRRSVLFERKLAALAVKEPPRRRHSQSEGAPRPPPDYWPGQMPSGLLVDSADMGDGGGGRCWTEADFGVLLPGLEQRHFQLMFGLSPDQCELTQMAHRLLHRIGPHSVVRARGAAGASKGHCRSAGLPMESVGEERIKLD